MSNIFLRCVNATKVYDNEFRGPSLLHINQQNVSNYIIYALEQEAALHAFFRIVESWLFRPFFLLNNRQPVLISVVSARNDADMT